MAEKRFLIDLLDIISIGLSVNSLKGYIKQAEQLQTDGLEWWYDYNSKAYSKYVSRAEKMGISLNEISFPATVAPYFDAYLHKDRIKANALSVNFEYYAQQYLAELDNFDLQTLDMNKLDNWFSKRRSFIAAADFLIEYSRQESDDTTSSAVQYALRVIEKLKELRLLIEKRSEEKRRINEQISRLVQPVEGRNLDNQQIDSIICDADNQLIIAGAGTGKTTTIVGKVKYLLKTNKCQPNELLLLSFTNKSAAEMKQRVFLETGCNLDVMTFHKLGLEIISGVEGKKPTIYSKSVQEFIRLNMEKYMKDNSFQKNLLVYCFLSPSKFKSPFDFESEKDYSEYIDMNPPITLKSETVKSYCEMEIANFLYRNRINYTYEKEYEIDVSDLQYTGYHPDFYLDDYGIYIEFYAVNKEGHVPEYFSAYHGGTSECEYLDKIKWKRQLHKEHNTILVELTYADKQDNMLCERLQKKLASLGVKFDPMSDDDVWNEVSKDNGKIFASVCDVIGNVITLIKSNGYTFDKVRELSCFQNQPLLDLTESVYNDYLNMLSKSAQIDFNDMIFKATEYVKEGKVSHDYSYVIVDEYQDISKARFGLLIEMRKRSFFKLFCVGDDWQSIYRFAGSDIGYILNFEQYWGQTSVSKIETTYRFSHNLIEISGRFIMKNPNQVVKSLKSLSDDNIFPLGVISAYNDKYLIKFMTEKLLLLDRNSTVFLIGRYTFDKDMLKDSELTVKYNNIIGSYEVNYPKRSDLKIEFITAHKSKGLQADYVFILNTKRKGMGFPSRIQDDPLIQLLLDGSDVYPFSEERRLFYVAMTRAKKKLWLLIQQGNESEFASELTTTYGNQIKSAEWTCPECGGRLVKRSGRNGIFIGCSNFPKNGCRFTRPYHSEGNS